MKAIAAVDLHWGIGYQGKLLEHIPEDMKFFKEMTLGHVVIMGRETLESLPGGKPLKDRINIVLSKSQDYQSDHVIICHSLDELFQEISKYKTDNIFVIGGESIYQQLIPYCTDAYITKIKKAYAADKYFTNLDELQNWTLVSESEAKKHHDIEYRFIQYANTLISAL